MISNYNYFIVFSQELNISKAAARLFISHQCLSKYLKNLEKEYGVAFFDRKPRLKLTPAGEEYLKMAYEIQFLERNLNQSLENLRSATTGSLRFGTTEGRYRLLIPELLTVFSRLFPDVKLEVTYNTSNLLYDRILNNEIDLALVNSLPSKASQFDHQLILREPLYLVISDNLLRQYFPDEYPACKETFKKGVDLAKCQHIPFIMNSLEYNSRKLMEEFLSARNIRLNCIQEITQLDLQFMLAARDYAACFTLAMYLPSVRNNQNLNVFPIQGFTKTSNLILIMRNRKVLPAYGTEFIKILKQQCQSYAIIQ